MSHWLLTVGHVHRLLWSICQSANCCNRNVVSKQFVFLLLDQINFDFWFFCLSLRRVSIIDTYSQLLSHYNFDHIHKNHYITTINMLADLLMIRVISWVRNLISIFGNSLSNLDCIISLTDRDYSLKCFGKVNKSLFKWYIMESMVCFYSKQFDVFDYGNI